MSIKKNINIFILIDVSGSMRSKNIQAASEHYKIIVDFLKELSDDQLNEAQLLVSAYTYANEATPLFEDKTVKSLNISDIDNVNIGGISNLNYALLAIAKKAESLKEEEYDNYLIIITDGGVADSDYHQSESKKIKETLDKMKKYAVLIGGSRDAISLIVNNRDIVDTDKIIESLRKVLSSNKS